MLVSTMVCQREKEQRRETAKQPKQTDMSKRSKEGKDKKKEMKCKRGVGESKRRMVKEISWGNGSAAVLQSRKRTLNFSEDAVKIRPPFLYLSR